SQLPYEENVAQVKELVKLAHAVGVSVEAELGHVGMANNYSEDRDAALTEPELAKKFIDETGIDCLAVAIGTAHGAYNKGQVPYLDFDRLVEINKA
ncbi:class II fructose-bisphosphate aldolase, partial [Clostridium sp. SL.3.18]|nr:class II fructose-bisphosphate aldolase [Clostridium sp. SL.3.18]